MTYQIREVDGNEFADTLHSFNSLDKYFPLLEPRHLSDGYWWLVFHAGEVIAFAGLVPFEPFPDIGYLKRAYVLPDHRGHGLQYRLITIRESKARELCWTQLVSECAASNVRSANNFRRAGFAACDPEQKWGAPGSVFWKKELI